MKTFSVCLMVTGAAAALLAQTPPAVISGPVGPSPYNVVRTISKFGVSANAYFARQGSWIKSFGSASAFGTNFCVRPY